MGAMQRLSIVGLIQEVALIYSEKILKVNELRKANQDESTVSG